MNRLLERYGTRVILTTAAGEQQVSAIFYSVNSRSWQNMERMFSPLGEIPRGQYICMLPIAAQAAAGDTVTVGQRAFLLRRVEEMTAMGEGAYRWCLCVEKGGADTWA